MYVSLVLVFSYAKTNNNYSLNCELKFGCNVLAGGFGRKV